LFSRRASRARRKLVCKNKFYQRDVDNVFERPGVVE